MGGGRVTDRRNPWGRRIGVGLIVVVLAAIGFDIATHENGKPNPSPTTTTTDTSSNRDVVTQSYWYCYDSGDPAPHHLGHYVSGDHYCTDQELRDAGMTP
jgi:hypothetical protein